MQLSSWIAADPVFLRRIVLVHALAHHAHRFVESYIQWEEAIETHDWRTSSHPPGNAAEPAPPAWLVPSQRLGACSTTWHYCLRMWTFNWRLGFESHGGRPLRLTSNHQHEETKNSAAQAALASGSCGNTKPKPDPQRVSFVAASWRLQTRTLLVLELLFEWHGVVSAALF